MKQPRPQGAFPWLCRWGATIPKPGESAQVTKLPMKVIFNTIFLSLFFARRPHQNCARVSHAMAQSFQTTLLLEKVRRYLAAFSYPDYSKLNSNWHKAWPVPNACAKLYHPEVSRQGASLLGIIKISNISKYTATKSV